MNLQDLEYKARQYPYDYLEVWSQNLIKLIAVVRAAEGVVNREDAGGYGREGIPELRIALEGLANE
jgi:hypothetical protein